MNRPRVALIVLAAAAAVAAFLLWDRRTNVADDHRRTRQLILNFTLSRADDPVIIIGDSIVEASTLPRSICGHAIVNAGLNGASTASDLANWLSPALAGKRAALIVVSLGTNDALGLAANGTQAFGERYRVLLSQLAKLTPQLATLQVPPVEVRGRMSAEMYREAMTVIDGYNAALPDMARRSGASFVALPTMPAPYTIDGVHLSSAGYSVWDKAVMQAAEKICG